MIVLAAELNQLGFEVDAYPLESVLQVIQYFFGEDATPVFGNKDQMHMHQKSVVY